MGAGAACPVGALGIDGDLPECLGIGMQVFTAF